MVQIVFNNALVINSITLKHHLVNNVTMDAHLVQMVDVLNVLQITSQLISMYLT
jgi:hypothetical protein